MLIASYATSYHSQQTVQGRLAMDAQADQCSLDPMFNLAATVIFGMEHADVRLLDDKADFDSQVNISKCS